MRFAFSQVDVFTNRAGYGNPLAVVHGAAALDGARMQHFANWTNLSETGFLLPPDSPEADYKVRIFTPHAELPFAGHPTLGSCHAWLAAGGVPKGDFIVQQCGVGLVRIKRDGTRLAFAAPDAEQSEVPPELLARIAAVLGVAETEILAARQLSHRAPGWTGVLLKDRETVLALKPDFAAMGELEIGVVAPSPGGPADFEVRAFVNDVGGEDPVTGSLNAGLARWLIPAGLAPACYVAAQGTALGREGRVFVAHDERDFWIGGESVEVISGSLAL
ncbi:MAG: PhzF family phenazine biosynthesis protein [Proteobacteria bacterium]|nr:PhzF family phenazine biosynthesis protein [Pseudomonadota bacterium]MBU6426082.1 PhzF family phenazine biosynthesis protein [Rhodospirillales bacterium]